MLRSNGYLVAALMMAACSGDDAKDENEQGDAKAATEADAAVGPDSGETGAPFDPNAVEDGSEHLFEPDHVLRVELTLDSEDWDTLGREGRSISSGTCGEDNMYAESLEYTYFSADLTLDGESVEGIGVRKKGFLGSLMVTRPSLKIDFDRFLDGLGIDGVGRLTLNNNKQDDSMLRQCITYMLFRKAGVHAPRCSFAHVTVNGVDLGTYSNVESLGRRFLRRRFANANGNLYEGQAIDFVEGHRNRFQLKTNREENDRSDIEAMSAALTKGDDDLLEALEPLIDIDRYLTYWAMEALTASWDSYSTTMNNYWFYNDPDSGIEFIPWGTDATLRASGLTGGERVQTVSISSLLSSRLYALPKMRERYEQRLRTLLDEIWHPDDIIAQLDAWEDLVGDANPESVEQIREFVRQRPTVIEAELEAGTDGEARTDEVCFEAGAMVAGTFAGVWADSAGSGASSSSTATLTLEGEPFPLTESTAMGLVGANPTANSSPGIALAGLDENGNRVSVSLAIEPLMYGVGKLPFHAISNIGFISGSILGDIETRLGFVADGYVQLDEAGSAPGEPVSGNFEGRIYGLKGL